MQEHHSKCCPYWPLIDKYQNSQQLLVNLIVNVISEMFLSLSNAFM